MVHLELLVLLARPDSKRKLRVASRIKCRARHIPGLAPYSPAPSLQTQAARAIFSEQAF
jgi:hypothetical protein